MVKRQRLKILENNEKPSREDVDFISKQVVSGDYFFLQMDPPSIKPLNIICGGREVCRTPYEIYRKGLKYDCLEYVASGQGILTLRGREYPLVPGTLFSYGPEIEHRIRVAPGSTMVKYFVDFNGKKSKLLLRGLYHDSQECVRVSDPATVERWFDELIICGKSTPGVAQSLSCLAFELLVARAAQMVLPEGGNNGRAVDKYRQIIEVINRNCLTIRNLDEVVRLCGVSKAYLCRVFARHHDETPYQYLISLKMGKAASLLMDQTLLVKEVAARTGYDDAFHFSKVFKSVYGVSPEIFRTNSR